MKISDNMADEMPIPSIKTDLLLLLAATWTGHQHKCYYCYGIYQWRPYE